MCPIRCFGVGLTCLVVMVLGCTPSNVPAKIVKQDVIVDDPPVDPIDRIVHDNPPPESCVLSDFSGHVDDASLLYQEAVLLRNCCPPALGTQCPSAESGCPGLCDLAPENSYLNNSVGHQNDQWANIWNKVSNEIHDLLDIYELLLVSNLQDITICNASYTRPWLFSEIVNRSRQVLEKGLLPQWDDVRQKEMFGYGAPLDENFAEAGLTGANYLWHFHAAAAIEPIARFISNPNFATSEASAYLALQAEFYRDMSEILSSYYSEWNGETYQCPGESAYQGEPVEVAQNQGASIAMAYLRLYDYSGDEFFFNRAIFIGHHLQNSIYSFQPNQLEPCYQVWNYSASGTRIEDPDHAMEDLRLAIFLQERGLVFERELVERMMTTWFTFGVNASDQLTGRIDGSQANVVTAKLRDVSTRSLFLLRYVPSLFQKAIGQVPFAQANSH